MFKTTLFRILIGLVILSVAACSTTAPATTEAPTAAPAATDAPTAAPAATDAPTAEKVSFSYMTFVGKDADQVGALIDTYEKLNPNVTIDYQIVDHDSLQQKLTTMAQTGTLPDMFWWNGSQIVDSYNQTQAILDLTPYLDADFKSAFVDGAFVNLTTQDGKIVGFPAESAVQGWVYYKPLWDKYGLQIPKTYDDLKAAVAVFKQNNVTTIAYGSKEGWAVWGFDNWMEKWGIWQQAPAIFKDHTLKAVDADFKKAFEAYAELYALGAFPANNATMSFDEAVSLFNSGKAAMITLPSDQLGKVIGQPNEKDYVYTWGVDFTDSPYPQNVGSNSVGNGFAISAKVADDQAKLAAIIAFNKWRYSQEGFELALKVGAILPVKRDVSKVPLGPIMKQQVAMIQDTSRDLTINMGLNANYASYRLWNSNGDLWVQGFYTIASNLYNSLMNGSMTADDIPVELAKMDEAIDQVLAQMKK